MQKKTKIIIGFVVLVAVVLLVVHFIGRGKEDTDDANVEARATPISTKVPGYISVLHVQDNQHVKKGDVLVEIDPRDYQLRLQTAQAALASAQVSARNAEVNAHRQQAIGRQAVSQREIDDATATGAIARANVESAKVQVATAEKDLADSRILAPEDGVVTLRTAEQGAYVNTGQQLFVLVGTERWVVANFKEVQITDMRPGQKVDIEVDAYPDLKLKGHIDSIQRGTGARFSAFPPENATGNFVKIVQRVPVKILLDTAIPDEVVLGPGLSVRPIVHTDEKPAA